MYTEASLEAVECGFKTRERKINSLHYADDITVMDENANNLETLTLVMKFKEHSENI